MKIELLGDSQYCHNPLVENDYDHICCMTVLEDLCKLHDLLNKSKSLLMLGSLNQSNYNNK